MTGNQSNFKSKKMGSNSNNIADPSFASGTSDHTHTVYLHSLFWMTKPCYALSIKCPIGGNYQKFPLPVTSMTRNAAP